MLDRQLEQLSFHLNNIALYVQENNIQDATEELAIVDKLLVELFSIEHSFTPNEVDSMSKLLSSLHELVSLIAEQKSDAKKNLTTFLSNKKGLGVYNSIK
ncbi:hypothetical protein [Pseudoalteromonas haloplanktis]|nr:hypothetical protein [Pseudoalteromonas haloplanktis]